MGGASAGRLPADAPLAASSLSHSIVASTSSAERAMHGSLQKPLDTFGFLGTYSNHMENI
eukprot:CAMPEP_0184393658 /NCGR_PEP_ID=MMETSP0007-20130409/35710_1 /TAXON_ID=97485 /ORGANISM="Prymnesium parvum, Strain Texoma1" /LENGTH=59 /DNA_ID=CAMNT_0026744789 /DNA_START=148 /DNA_END=327 /DNA_ORIENTATION=+